MSLRSLIQALFPFLVYLHKFNHNFTVSILVQLKYNCCSAAIEIVQKHLPAWCVVSKSPSHTSVCRCVLIIDLVASALKPKTYPQCRNALLLSQTFLSLDFPELCCHWLFYIAAIEVFWLLPWTRRLLPSASRLWSGYSGSTRLTWSASCLHRYMHFPPLLPLGLSVGHRRHKVLCFQTACYIACAASAEQFAVLP